MDKLTEMLGSPHLAGASREVRATAAQVALEAARVPLRDIIDDALLRSKALAAFEADKAFDLQASQMRAERRAQVLRDQVDVFRRQKNAEIEELKRTIDAADSALAQLRARKRREQERLHRVVTHFVEPRPGGGGPGRRAVARPRRFRLPPGPGSLDRRAPPFPLRAGQAAPPSAGASHRRAGCGHVRRPATGAGRPDPVAGGQLTGHGLPRVQPRDPRTTRRRRHP